MIKNEIVQSLCKQDIPHTAFRVLVYLLSRQGKNEYTWPGIRTIARDCCMSKASVQLSINVLEEKNLIIKCAQKTHKSKKHRSNHYVVQSDFETPKDTNTISKNSASNVLKSSTSSCQISARHRAEFQHDIVSNFSTSSCQISARDHNTNQRIQLKNTKKVKINFSFLKNENEQYYEQIKIYFKGMKNTINYMSTALEKVACFRKDKKMDIQKELQHFIDYFFIRTLKEKVNIRFYIKLDCLVQCFNTYITSCLTIGKNYTEYPDYLRYHPRIQSIQDFVDKEKQLETFYMNFPEIYKSNDRFKNPGLKRYLKEYTN